MRRRQVVVSSGAGMPLHVQRFEVEEWIDRSQPIPAGWLEPPAPNGLGYHGFRARRRWMEARRRWIVANDPVLADEKYPNWRRRVRP